jgi:hypothetical protein
MSLASVIGSEEDQVRDSWFVCFANYRFVREDVVGGGIPLSMQGNKKMKTNYNQAAMKWQLK